MKQDNIHYLFGRPHTHIWDDILSLMKQYFEDSAISYTDYYQRYHELCTEYQESRGISGA